MRLRVREWRCEASHLPLTLTQPKKVTCRRTAARPFRSFYSLPSLTFHHLKFPQSFCLPFFPMRVNVVTFICFLLPMPPRESGIRQKVQGKRTRNKRTESIDDAFPSACGLCERLQAPGVNPGGHHFRLLIGHETACFLFSFYIIF